jgi:hypothetical protein
MYHSVNHNHYCGIRRTSKDQGDRLNSIQAFKLVLLKERVPYWLRRQRCLFGISHYTGRQYFANVNFCEICFREGFYILKSIS